MATTKTEHVPNKAKVHTVYKLANGTRVPGVTTVLNVLAKPQLVKWANNLGLQGIDSSKYVDELAQIGTLAHYLIMCDLTGQSPNVREYSQEQQDRAAQSIASWMAWRRVHTIEPILTETPLISERYGYGGSQLVYLQYGMGSGPWIVMSVNEQTGKQARRIPRSGEWMNIVDAEAGLHALAAAKGWREVTAC